MLTEPQKQLLDAILEMSPDGKFSVKGLAYYVDKTETTVRAMLGRILVRAPKAFKRVAGGYELKR